MAQIGPSTLNLRRFFVLDAVARGDLILLPIKSMDNVADLSTKPLAKVLLFFVRKLLMGL